MSNADRLAELIRSGPHSFRAIRERTDLKLTDDEFADLIRENANRFKAVRFAKKDDQGERIEPGRPGVKLIGI